MKCVTCSRELPKKHNYPSIVVSFYTCYNVYQWSDYGPVCIPCDAELSTTGRIPLDTATRGRDYAVRVVSGDIREQQEYARGERETHTTGETHSVS